MRFTPRTEEEVSKNKLLFPGECDFEVRKAQAKTSKNNNEMVELSLEVWDSKGGNSMVFDYLLDAMPHKLRHFCYAVGLGRAYEAGTVDAAQCEGKGGRLIIRNVPGKGEYPPKNEVADYVVADRTKETASYKEAKRNGSDRVGATAANPISDKKEFEESDIPF
jgi:hypothetical protein